MSKQEMTMEREGEILQDAVDVFGAEQQMNMAIEEMSELTKAICKYRRAEDEAARELATMSIREEAADVGIMLAQLLLMFGGNADCNVHLISKGEH